MVTLEGACVRIMHSVSVVKGGAVAIGLIIIGDEILSGRYKDKHLSSVIQILSERGLKLDWARYLADDPEAIARTLKEAYAARDIVFCCGGIGSTPDDYTRQSAAVAFGRPLVMHPEARAEIEKRIREVSENPDKPDYDSPDNVRRLMMGEFPEGSVIIPNPVSHFPGFSFGTLYFVPGFPQMAHPMIAWALDMYHREIFNTGSEEILSVNVRGVGEAAVTPLLEHLVASFPEVKFFSLPHMGAKRSDNYIELGVKGKKGKVEAAFESLLQGLKAMDAQTKVQ